jgi:signal transduction histidine kinase
LLSVSDNGAGLNGSHGAARGNGVGLANTRSRLLHLYGEGSRLEVATAVGGGFEARIELPFRTVPS